jgi:glutathione S-transferase
MDGFIQMRPGMAGRLRHVTAHLAPPLPGPQACGALAGHRLYNSNGPNPHVVRVFLAEKGLLASVAQTQVNIREGENRKPPYVTEVNTRGQLPALQLPSGNVLSEILPICEYIEELQPGPTPSLVGSSAEERGGVRMWTRRVDLYLCEPMSAGFRFGAGREVFQSRMRCPAEAAEGMQAIAVRQPACATHPAVWRLASVLPLFTYTRCSRVSLVCPYPCSGMGSHGSMPSSADCSSSTAGPSLLVRPCTF